MAVETVYYISPEYHSKPTQRNQRTIIPGKKERLKNGIRDERDNIENWLKNNTILLNADPRQKIITSGDGNPFSIIEEQEVIVSENPFEDYTSICTYNYYRVIKVQRNTTVLDSDLVDLMKSRKYQEVLDKDSLVQKVFL